MCTGRSSITLHGRVNSISLLSLINVSTLDMNLPQLSRLVVFIYMIPTTSRVTMILRLTHVIDTLQL